MPAHGPREILRQTSKLVLCGLALTLTSPITVYAAKMPPITTVKTVVSAHFAKLPDHQSNDIISKSDVAPILKELAKRGWKVSDEKQLIKELLDDQNVLVRTLRTKKGKAFMRKVSGQKNVYDRLDRVAREKNGSALIRKIVALPDGHKYVGARQKPGTPTLSDLLLINKRGSAHKRKLKDFEKPTGMRYTSSAFWMRLQVSYKRDLKRAKKSS